MDFSHILERNSLSWKSWLETSLPIMSSIICSKGHIYSHSAFFIDLVQDEGLGHNCKALMNRCLLHATTQIIFQASQHCAVFSVWTSPRIWDSPWNHRERVPGFVPSSTLTHWGAETKHPAIAISTLDFVSWRVEDFSYFFLFIQMSLYTGLYGNKLQ